ncbi:MAG: hypoxanthine phosphoribosyltransferase, partial [Actinomycetota bacterium]|nr:hypoxanthine phosphoribosyltransferase [Actinomycetota bacterium]
DDQAETVLLGLARGAGTRSLSGMAAVSGLWRRPLLGLDRSTLRAACLEAGRKPWEDPHNADPSYTRVRVRLRVLPVVEGELGPGVAAALARSAALLREDADALDAWSARAAREAAVPGAPAELDVAVLTALPPAVRRRVLRSRALAAGCPASDLSAVHVHEIDRLVVDWRGQGPLELPGRVAASRACGRLSLVRTAPAAPVRARRRGDPVDAHDMGKDLQAVLVSEESLQARLREIAAEIDRDYAGRDLLLVGVLKGAVMVMADLSRALHLPAEMDWMAVSSYGSGTKSSGVVRILKDLDGDIGGRDVLIVEDIIDSGLTLSWLLANLASRGPASLEVCTLLRKPEAAKVAVDVRYVGFDIPNEFVVGYGLDYAERYRNLPFVGTLAPHVYSH